MLQHALMRMAGRKMDSAVWELTKDDFAEVGGNQALSKHADQLFDALVESEGERVATLAAGGNRADARALQRGRTAVAEGMARIFRALIDVDPGGRGVRRPCEIATLIAVSGLEPESVRRIVDRFAEKGNQFARPLRPRTPVAFPRERVDISHEALLRNWTRMTGTEGRGGWLREEVDDGLIWRSLAVTARTRGPRSTGPPCAIAIAGSNA